MTSHKTDRVFSMLTDAFRQSVYVVYGDEKSNPDNFEKPLVTHNEIYDHLTDHYPIVRFYGLKNMDNAFHDLMRSDYFNAQNRNDTVDMLAEKLKVLVNPAVKSQNMRLESAKFVLELLSVAHAQVKPF